MKTSEILQTAYELIKEEKNWTQGVCARNAKGEEVYFNSMNAVSFCTAGALARTTATDNVYELCWHALTAHLRDSGGGLSRFNDTHSHAEVCELFQRAIAAEQQKGN